MKYDKKLLNEDIEFPLHFDVPFYSYIWDKKNSMIADITDNTIDEKAIHISRAFLDFVILNINLCNVTFDNHIKKDICYLKDDIIYIKAKETYKETYFPFVINDYPFIRIRNWGELQYKDNAEQRQDNILHFLVKAINHLPFI